MSWNRIALDDVVREKCPLRRSTPKGLDIEAQGRAAHPGSFVEKQRNPEGVE
jgi:hypothetical protein